MCTLDVVLGNPPYITLSKIKEQSTFFENAGYETYVKGADIYCIFFEKGNQILKDCGFITYITSNSWLRAIYGDLLKKYFVQKMQPISLLNIQDLQVFEEATVESCIITLQRKVNEGVFYICNLTKEFKANNSLSEYFSNNRFELDITKSLDWTISNQAEGNLKRKIESGTMRLKDFKVTINFGIKTGYNAAYIIDDETKDKLIIRDSKCAEIIKPILRGRDIQKYSYECSNHYLINSHNGLKQKGIMRIQIEKNYPVIYKHFLQFLPQVEERYDKGEHWTNLRNCAYLDDFEKPKIIWGEISDKPKFAYDENHYYAEATAFIMTGEKLKYLLAILNSKVSEWYFNQISTTTGMGTNRWKKYKIELLPIPVTTIENELELESLVDRILVTKLNNSAANTGTEESEIDHLVYELYGLTEDEIKIVEGKNEKY